jgi:hypothetical protein
LHSAGYNTHNFFESLEKVPRPADCTIWTDQDKELFKRFIYEHRKDLLKVAKAMKKSFSSCYCYFLSTYKKTDDYLILKIVCKQKKKEEQEEKDKEETCIVCKDGGDLILCEACETPFHISCLRPPLLAVPDSDWFCDNCVYEKLLQARSLLLESTRFRQAWDRDVSRNRNKPNDGTDITETPLSSSSISSDNVPTAPQENSLISTGELPMTTPHSALEKFIKGFVSIMEL